MALNNYPFKMNQARARRFAEFVNTISKTDLFSCLSLWMEESPLATISVCGDFESLSASGKDQDDYRDSRVDNEDTLCDVLQESGPLRKKFKINNCNIDEKDKELDTLLQVHESKTASIHVDDTTGAINAGHFKEPFANCIESSSRLDEEKNPSKGYISRLNKIGVVMVDSRENIVAVDCSRDDVHGVTNILVDFSDLVANCVIYTSRKPCSLCTKLMVQAGISRVCYLPFEPENPDEHDLDKVEKLCRMSEIGQSIYVPNIQKTVLVESEVKRSPYAPHKISHTSVLFTLLNRYWSEEWKRKITLKLHWPEFNECKQQVDHSILVMLEWISRVTFGDLPDSVSFYQCEGKNPNSNEASSGRARETVPNHEDTPIIPDANNPRWQELARHMSRMANILAQRSNDPKRGVGAVIIQRNQIVSAGWNGYPPKANYGDFPRASHIDGPSLTKKYAFSIHAEQAVILSRNTRDISEDSSTMFVSKTPCDECVPLILKAGIKNVVFPRDNQQRNPACLKYILIQRSIAQGKLNGFESRFPLRTQRDGRAEGPAMIRTPRQLCFNEEANGLVADASK